LHDAFKKASRDPDNVKRLLNAEDSQFDAWISGKEPLPGSAQTMIAGVLETPRRELFTDIPPEEARQSADGVSQQQPA
jgi:succinate dehydrogenase flavin-adding protein (antitoxin of CptAB toxin-antitoxin module)